MIGIPIVIGLVYGIIGSVIYVRTAIRNWRVANRPLSYMLRFIGRSPEYLSAADRACLLIGAWHVALAMMFLGMTLHWLNIGSQSVAAGLLVFGIVFVFVIMILIWSVRRFNRPKVFVPPRLRSEHGSWAGRSPNKR